MTTSPIHLKPVNTAIVKGEHCILDDDGTVRVYDCVAGYFVPSSNAPSARSVKAAIKAGRVGRINVACGE